MTKKFVLCFFLAFFTLNLGNVFASLDESSISLDKKGNNEKNEEKEKQKKEPFRESEYEPVLIGKLLQDPKSYLEKKIVIKGKFSSFTTLALDYPPAMRKSKDYISLCIFRPDSKIPLSELKLAYPVSEAKESDVIKELEENDLIEIYGKVFSAALDEPWVDIVQLKSLTVKDKKENTAESKEVKGKKEVKDKKKLNKKQQEDKN